jgi:hypothetical protein
MADLYVALLHHPVYDKNGAVVTTSVTNLDVHDIARLARTFGVRAFYVCTPVPTLRRLVERIMRHWETGPGSTYNVTRKEALRVVRLVADLDEAMADVERETAVLPRVVATSARPGAERLSFATRAPRSRHGLGSHPRRPRASRRRAAADRRRRRLQPPLGPSRRGDHA